MRGNSILISGAYQNNLKGISLRIPLNRITVITGVSGSGKSSLAFDTIYAEGQRRYVETFSPYARQFFERMDKPRVDRIEGIPPAIAIDQVNPVRTSRSTVGTMTEINDYLKLLFARSARLFCKGCGRQVRRDTPQSICREMLAVLQQRPGIIDIIFPVQVPQSVSEYEVRQTLSALGYQRIVRNGNGEIAVIHDRVAPSSQNVERLTESIEAALHHGRGRMTAAIAADEEGNSTYHLHFSSHLHCPRCNIHYRDPQASHFSFNSPLGACETCRGFGRTIAIDYDLVIPDPSQTLSTGAIKPWQSPAYRECLEDCLRFARLRGIPIDRPWRELTQEQRDWVIEGEGRWEDGRWYGVRRFFEWLESKSYRMHIRVFLSRYRTYRRCGACNGSRLKPEALLWRIGGRSIHELMLMPLGDLLTFFNDPEHHFAQNEAVEVLLNEIKSRLGYLCEVGLDYLTLDRQSRTLSGGEVQRINLTTALGASLTGTLLVLDEPSIGLHYRDTGRLIKILKRLRDAGNTLVIVEHDPAIIQSADYVIDLGPGPGEQGGTIVFSGSVAGLLDSKKSLTGRYLAGNVEVKISSVTPLQGEKPVEKSMPALVSSCSSDGLDIGGSIRILGAAQHNLKNVDVEIPLRRLVCVCGVSGSGKSTLIHDVLYYGLRRLKNRPLETPGLHQAIEGANLIGDVIMVDQSPIGKTARSNPASYVGALGTIRKLFAAAPLARQRGYTAGTFSFNSGTGRCPRCSGSGFEHIEMQFLSDVYLRCPDCDGKRFRPEVLEVKLRRPSQAPKGFRASRRKNSNVPQTTCRALSIADVLELTVSEACVFFENVPDVVGELEPLRSVGLDYMRLGQPVSTLSGGEAQRLKLAGHLVGKQARNTGGALLFLLDEPTTGLHFADVAVLLSALRRLIAAGHSVVVIEHNLDVIRNADWLIELGPEGGERGGRVVAVGTPGDIAACAESPTGAALRNETKKLGAGKGKRAPCLQADLPATKPPNAIVIKHAREHNLKNITLSIPHNTFTVITGISGSGKSTVAFDILFAEGQRRYLECFNAYARQFVQPVSRPDVEAISGIMPTVAIEQRTSRGGRKSTVATVTEVYHFLRLLFVKLGTQYCPSCNIPIAPQTPAAIAAAIQRQWPKASIVLYAPLVVNRKGHYGALASWALQQGFTHLRVDGSLIPTENWPRLDRYKEHTIELPLGPFKANNEGRLQSLLARALEHGHGVVYVETASPPGGTPQQRKIFSTRRACPSCSRSFEELDPRLFSFNSKHGWCSHCYGTGLILEGFDENQTGEEIWWNEWWGGGERICPTCNGARLRPEALAVRFHNRNIASFTALSVREARKVFDSIPLAPREQEIARDIIAELRSRLDFLIDVGLSYLTLDRPVPTLSGGEAQRIRLAAQLGSSLRNVCYVLDEPTIGLHTRDSRMLLRTLSRLKAKGNTLVVVEHDEETIRHAEHIIDLGPGAGAAGGSLVAQGTIETITRDPLSITGRFLREPLRHPQNPRRRVDSHETKWLVVRGACLHNLKNITAAVPLERLVCVTGVSGSGKSTLVRDILLTNLRSLLAGRTKKNRSVNLIGCSALQGIDNIKRVLEVDQTPIGRTPRSCPATYTGIWDHIRQLFASSSEASIRGYTMSRFSFNVPGGRCEACEGYGVKTVEMSFLPNVTVPCDECNGKRFSQQTLEVTFGGLSIADVLAMTVDEAAEFFSNHRPIQHTLRLLKDIGLGYLTLGQQSPTLSGGEAQRIKLIAEVSRIRSLPTNTSRPNRSSGNAMHTLYILDEPTIGLHMADVEKLLAILHRLVDAGNTVVVIEHNLDVIAQADWIIDLGPEGGNRGGSIVVCGSPVEIAKRSSKSYTAKALRQLLRKRAAT